MKYLILQESIYQDTYPFFQVNICGIGLHRKKKDWKKDQVDIRGHFANSQSSAI
jgi:hypothetical protein